MGANHQLLKLPFALDHQVGRIPATTPHPLEPQLEPLTPTGTTDNHWNHWTQESPLVLTGTRGLNWNHWNQLQPELKSVAPTELNCHKLEPGTTETEARVQKRVQENQWCCPTGDWHTYTMTVAPQPTAFEAEIRPSVQREFLT